MADTKTADELAQRCADAMYARDAAARGMGIAIDAVGDGRATVSMTVRADMVNGHDIAHGGFVFALADTAFAYACNSRDEPNIALQVSISFVSAARRGERLVAEARAVHRGGRVGLYDVDVTRPDGTLVASFRGVPYRVAGRVIES